MLLKWEMLRRIVIKDGATVPQHDKCVQIRVIRGLYRDSPHFKQLAPVVAQSRFVPRRIPYDLELDVADVRLLQ